MTNFSAKILNNAVSSLRAQQAVISTTSNNIANVNTPGYAKRGVDLQTRVSRGNSGVNIGNGVDIGGLTRMVDSYLDSVMRQTQSETKSAEVVNDFMGRVEELFSSQDGKITVGTALTQFFVAANDLAANPSSLEVRSNFIERGQDLVSSITTTFNSIADLQTEADERLKTEVDTVNSLTSQIADLNDRVAAIEGDGHTIAADERDGRDALLKQLSEKLDYKAIESDSGAVTIVLSNGFSLVSGGTSRSLSVTSDPGFAAGNLPKSLAGGVLSYIVYDYSGGAGTAQVDLTDELSVQNGTIGGLLKVRGTVDPSLTTPSAFQADGHLVEIASRVEAITLNLLGSVNQTYLGPDRSSSTVGWQPSSGDLDGNTPAIYGLFDFSYAGAKDTDGDGFPDDLGTHSLGNYSSLLRLTSTDPRDIAAARDATPSGPTATFVTGDGRNMEAIAGLRTTTMNFATGTFAINSTFEDAYNELASTVSNKKSRAELDLSVSESRLTSAESKRDSVSGVSLDEEFTQLIRYQKAYEAAARLVKTAQQLLDEIVSLV